MIVVLPCLSFALYTRNISSGLKIISSCSVFIPSHFLHRMCKENVSPWESSLWKKPYQQLRWEHVFELSTYMSGENVRRKLFPPSRSICECELPIRTSTDSSFVFDLLKSTVIPIAKLDIFSGVGEIAWWQKLSTRDVERAGNCWGVKGISHADLIQGRVSFIWGWVSASEVLLAPSCTYKLFTIISQASSSACSPVLWYTAAIMRLHKPFSITLTFPHGSFTDKRENRSLSNPHYRKSERRENYYSPESLQHRWWPRNP